jgi:hypothetical protein
MYSGLRVRGVFFGATFTFLRFAALADMGI